MGLSKYLIEFLRKYIIFILRFKNDWEFKMRVEGIIKGRNIVLEETLPEQIKEGERVEVIILPLRKKDYHFPTFKLGIKEEYLKREKIYGEN